MKRTRGFTLIEILVALMIFAIMGVLAAMSLHSIIRTHMQLKKTDHQLLQLQVTMTLLRRDIAEVINRSARDASGNSESAFSSQNNEILLTRTGLLNPFHANRQSDMQRVGYVLRDGDLVRLTWDVLDQPPHAVPESQIMLSGVQSLQWQFIAADGATSSVWPPAVNSKNLKIQTENLSPLPKVVLVVMHIKNMGILQGVFPIPARGVNAM